MADEDAGKCLRFLTELEHAEIEALDAARSEAPQKRESQTKLAEELTRLIHGEAGLKKAQLARDIFFGAEINNLTDADLADVLADVPSSELPWTRLSEGLPMIDAFVEVGLSKSKGDARRTIQQGGAYVNNIRREDVATTLGPDDLASESMLVLRSGKKKYALLRFVKD